MSKITNFAIHEVLDHADCSGHISQQTSLEHRTCAVMGQTNQQDDLEKNDKSKDDHGPHQLRRNPSSAGSRTHTATTTRESSVLTRGRGTSSTVASAIRTTASSILHAASRTDLPPPRGISRTAAPSAATGPWPAPPELGNCQPTASQSTTSLAESDKGRVTITLIDKKADSVADLTGSSAQATATAALAGNTGRSVTDDGRTDITLASLAPSQGDTVRTSATSSPRWRRRSTPAALPISRARCIALVVTVTGACFLNVESSRAKPDK